MKNILITGCNGMIGYNLIRKLKNNFLITGIDKESTKNFDDINFFQYNLNESSFDYKSSNIFELLNKINPDIIIHLAADTGISYSFNNPHEVVQNNTTSFINILEYIRLSQKKIKFLYASSSSVYGKSNDNNIETNQNLNPLSSYGLSKLMNEKIAQIYFDNYNISSIGLRFFTVYGEYNRNNMFMYYLLQSFSHQKEIKLYNNGLMKRDFTYVGDVTESIFKFINNDSINNHQIFNIGGHQSQSLISIVNIMESLFNKKPNIILDKSIPIYDPLETQCINTKLTNFFPDLVFTPTHKGIEFLFNWYNSV